MASAVEFDFRALRDRPVPLESITPGGSAGLYYWIDIDVSEDPPAVEALLKRLGINSYAIEQTLGPDVDGRHDVYDECVHIAVTSGWLADEHLSSSHVDILVAGNYLITVRRGSVRFIEQMRRSYKQDFLKFAKSPGFLLFEVWDHLIESYRMTIGAFADRVRRLQSGIFGQVSDEIFTQVADLTRDLLAFRKMMLAAREVLHELASRRSDFVPETTQPFLEKMVDTMERLSSDLAVEREVLAETLNLYMGIVSHRTNKIINRLTVVSLVFLPLSFLVGVYGMNFANMPELEWKYAYPLFWCVIISIAAASLGYMRRKGWW